MCATTEQYYERAHQMSRTEQQSFSGAPVRGHGLYE